MPCESDSFCRCWNSFFTPPAILNAFLIRRFPYSHLPFGNHRYKIYICSFTASRWQAHAGMHTKNGYRALCHTSMMTCHKYMTYTRMLSATMPAHQNRGWGRDLYKLAFKIDLSQFAGHNDGPRWLPWRIGFVVCTLFYGDVNASVLWHADDPHLIPI
jgi:hypothetical protein